MVHGVVVQISTDTGARQLGTAAASRAALSGASGNST